MCCSISHPNQGYRKAAVVAAKRTNSPGLLCGHWAPLLSGRSQRCPVIVCHLPAGHSSAQGTSLLGHPWDKDQKGGTAFAFPPFPGCPKRDLPPPHQLCDMDTTYELQMGVRTTVGSGQAILQCPRCWQKAELETSGGSPVLPAAGGGARQGAVPAQMPGSLSLGPGAAARHWHCWGFAGTKQAGMTLTPRVRTCSGI